MRMTFLIAVLISFLAGSNGLADPSGKFEDLGPQITSKLLQGSTFTHDPAGRLLACTVARGAPAKLIVIDAETGKVEHAFALNEAHGAWNATTATDNSVYVGTDPTGHFFRYVPGEDHIHELGVAIDTWVWDVCAGKDGEVFISTYPKGMVVRYHPNDGFSDVSHGPLVPGENYARSISYHAATDTLYVGIGSHAHLMKLNPRTGEKQDITPPEIKAMDFAYTVDVLGDNLMIHTTPGTSSFLYELASMKLLAKNESTPITHCATQSPNSPAIYYTAGALYRLDPTAASPAPVEIVRIGDANAFHWVDPSTLMIFNKNGKIFTVKIPAAGGSNVDSPVAVVNYDAPAQLTLIQSTFTGPDGRIWSGGYLSGGAAAFDPATGKHEQYGNVSQPEEMTSIGSSIAFGCYPGANLWIYDTTKPWNAKAMNPRKYAELESQGQSRPVAMLGVPELHTVFTGTVAEYGHLDGLFAAYNVDTNALKTYRDFVHNQSIISLALCKGLIVGGTSISGGLGQPPTEKEGKLFIVDPKTNEKIYEAVPVSGKTLVGALTVGPDGNIWGLAGGTIFIFDPATKKVLAAHEILKDAVNDSGWRAGRLVFHTNGTLYMTTSKELLSIDVKTFEHAILRAGSAHHATLDSTGRLYFVFGETNLWRYTP